MQIIMPATVQSYSSATQRAKLKPAVCPVRDDGSFLDIPVLPDVPVVFPGGGGWELTFNITTGDTLLLVVASSSVDEWKLDGNPASKPKSKRNHDVSDAFAMPDIRPISRPRLHSTVGVMLSNLAGTTQLELTDATALVKAPAAVVEADSVALGSASATDFVASGTLFDAQIAALNTWFTVVGGVVGTPPPVVTAISLTKTRAE